MRSPFLVFPLLLLSQVSGWAGTPQQAEATLKEYDLGMQQVTLKLKLATTPDERTAALADKPDAVKTGRKLWAVIQPNLGEEWALEPAAWLVKMSPSLVAVDANGTRRPAMTDALQAIRKSVESNFIKSKKIAPYCMALVSANDPTALNLLKKIETENPDPEIQGIAALAQAMLMKGLGEDAEAINHRLTLIKKAVINSSDAVVDGVAVSKLARDEIYIIRFLSKGREAPEISGVGSGGESMSLSSYRGKVVLLLFWTASSDDSQGMADTINKMKEKYADKNLAIVGVNADSTALLRKMQADGQVKWPNFSDPEKKIAGDYRVGVWPLIYVLDAQQRIQYVGNVGSFVDLTVSALLEQS